MTEKIDIKYGGEYERNLVDIFIEKSTTDEKKKDVMLVYVHGGLWKDGDKKQYHHLKAIIGSEKLKERYDQLMLCILNYPLSTVENGIVDPVHVTECSRAINYLINQATKHYSFTSPLDVYLMGHSCGATMNTLLYFDPKNYGFDKENLNKIRGKKKNLLKKYFNEHLFGLYYSGYKAIITLFFFFFFCIKEFFL